MKTPKNASGEVSPPNLPRVRFTVRRMMVAVAVFALLAQIGRMYLRSQDLNRIAQFYARSGGIAAYRARNIESGTALLHGYSVEERKAAVDQARRSISDSAQMEAKYRRAARLPWLPVATEGTATDQDLR